MREWIDGTRIDDAAVRDGQVLRDDRCAGGRIGREEDAAIADPAIVAKRESEGIGNGHAVIFDPKVRSEIERR